MDCHHHSYTFAERSLAWNHPANIQDRLTHKRNYLQPEAHSVLRSGPNYLSVCFRFSYQYIFHNDWFED